MAGTASRDIVATHLGGALAQVGPLVGLLEEAELRGPLGAPDDTGRAARSVETGMGQVALVRRAELTVDFTTSLCRVN